MNFGEPFMNFQWDALLLETSFLFGLAVNKAFKNFHQRLQEVGGGLTAIVDDNYAIGLSVRQIIALRENFHIFYILNV